MDKKELTIGKKIQNWRKKKGLTQDALARKVDMPYTTLAKIESDVIKGPSIHTVAKIAEGLGISLDELMRK
ncbi:MAG: helix-turn-helix transcriptional regulator [Elusimicrobia bacterium]|nr:helix-turn-helix transcriptional regulator [Elusimicrobiota bacterium]